MIDQNFPQIPSLSGDFARIQTRVPPGNPYNLIHNPTDPFANHSNDNTHHPIVNSKNRNHGDYIQMNK
jgi:hypothetical protein